MKKKRIVVVGILLLICTLTGGCTGKNSGQVVAETTVCPTIEAVDADDENSSVEAEETKSTLEQEAVLPDGVYTAEFDTDSSMFRVNEACDGKGTLTIKNGKMTIHISLGYKNILNLYPGLAEDAKKDGAKLLMPTVDTVTYSDG